jgi:hypothetical protein
MNEITTNNTTNKVKESSLAKFNLNYKLTNHLNTVCGIYIIYVGDKAYIIKTTSSIAASVSRQYKMLIKGTNAFKPLQDVFNRCNKALWFTPLIILPLRIGDDKKSYNDVIDCLFYSLLKGITDKDLLLNKVLKEPDKTVLSCLELNRPKQIKAMFKSIELINNIFVVSPWFDFNVINSYLTSIHKHTCIHYIQKNNCKVVPVKLWVDNYPFITINSND